MFNPSLVSLRRFLGSPHDWIHRPRLRIGLPSLSWIGPVAIVTSLLAVWPAFAGAVGEGGESVAFGLFVGAGAITAMAWSFLLAVRLKVLEQLFGGLDRVYRAHRWAGALSVVLMFLHTRIEPEITNGVRGASRTVAEAAEGLAGVGEVLIYALILVTALRIVPYRIWRWTHKLLGVPFAFASWHFFTASKPYENSSPWGWWFGAVMVTGLVSFLARVFVRDGISQGSPHRVEEAHVDPNLITLSLAPQKRPLGHRHGQFAFLRIDRPGLSEPHPFSIASSPSDANLRFSIRRLGDWSNRLAEHDLVGTPVAVEGPYGRFRPLGPTSQQSVCIAGGVGVAPFLSALSEVEPGNGPTPKVFYACRNAGGDPLAQELDDLASTGQIELHLFDSSLGQRLTSEALRAHRDSIEGAHVALCGPTALVRSMGAASHRLGAAQIESEDFDIRSGVGPERSLEVERWWRRLRGAVGAGVPSFNTVRMDRT